MAQEGFLCWAMAGRTGSQLQDASLIPILPEPSPTFNIKTIFFLPFSATDYLLEPDQLDIYYHKIKHNGTRRTLRL